jgi:beta-galactosidase
MAVDRDRWYGAPFDEQGRERELAPVLRRFFAALTRLDFHLLKRRVSVGIMIPKEYRDLARSLHTLGAFSPSLLSLAGSGTNAACHQGTLDYAQPIQLAYTQFIANVARALRDVGLPYVYVESDADETNLAELQVLITPSYEFAQPVRWQRLRAFAANGGKVIYGPRLPSEDERFAPQAFVEPESAERCSGEEAACRELAQRLVIALAFEPRFAATLGVQTTVHEDDAGPKVVFMVQQEARFVQSELSLPEPMALVDVLTDERFEGEQSVRVPMSGASCRMLAIERAGERGERTGNNTRRRAPSARRSEPPC